MNEDAQIDEFDFEPMQAAYIRPVAKSTIEDAPEDAPDTLYALHDADGRPLALFTSLDTAKVTARSHNLDAMAVQ